MKKRIFALLLAVITVLSAYPVYSLTASAQGEEEPAVVEPAGNEAEELIPQDSEEEDVSEEGYEEEIEESSAPPALFSVTPYAAETGDDSTTTISDEAFQISIKYVYRHDNPSTVLGEFDGTRAANPFTVSLPTGGFYSGTVATPLEVGYLPYVKIEDKDYVTPGTSSTTPIFYGTGEKRAEYVEANSITLDEVGSHTEITVYYIPQTVNYTVRYFEQNLYDDEYTLAATLIRTGIANTAVGKNLNTPRVGFHTTEQSPDEAPYEDNTPIDEDGLTVIDIYYDRNYYNVTFEVDAEVNGATNHYVRYNTPLALPRPTLKGYDFGGWRLESVTDINSQTVAEHSYSQTVAAGAPVTIQHNLVYTADWTTSDTTYTVVYWLENSESTNSSDKGNYDVWYTHKIESVTGAQTIAGGDHIKTYVNSGNGFTNDQINDVTNTYPYLIYNSALTDTGTKTLAGDGTTTVNVYYAKKEYDLKFYYAIEKVSNNKSTYHLIGGSTYYFGSYASGNAQTDEIQAMRQYATGGYTSQTGQVTALPTLNAKGAARAYTVGADTDGANKYHYISFKAKYGADISNLWPCDVFNAAERSSANTHGNWSGRNAFVSAWNGEYRVRYTLDSSVNNGNQTIKGNYTVLDANLLWNNPSGVNDTTVAYACFWENGANINWSVPELYRYNIYLPLLPNQNTTGLTLKVYNGTTYYLADQYNTCDDSTPAAQTQPGIMGFTANGRSTATITSFDTTLYKEAYDIFFFYRRNIYHLTFNDQHGNTVATSVPYGTFIGDHNEEEHAPSYPSDLEIGEAKFAGWYYDEACSVFFDHNTTMPAKNIQLYAKWQTLSYEVKVYYDTQKTAMAEDYPQTIQYGFDVAEPRHDLWQAGKPDYTDLVFAGWYYKNGNDEIRFDFATMWITADVEIYGKWTSSDTVGYTINYVTYIDGEKVPIAAPTQHDALAGTSKFFIAKTGADLYDGYRTGYFPEMRSHTMVIKSVTAENEYDFVYTHAETLSYSVEHIFTDKDTGNQNLFNSILGTNELIITFNHSISGEDIANSAASVYVSFKEGISKAVVANAVRSAVQSRATVTDSQITSLWNKVKQMSPDFYEQKIVLTTTQENSASFKWENRGGNATYQIVHYYEDLNGELIPDFGTSQEHVAQKGTQITASPIIKEGFTYWESASLASGEVTGLEINDNGSISDGLVLRLYYTRNRYDYTVKFKKANSDQELAEQITGRAAHGTVITVGDVCIDIDGYAIANPTETYTIAAEGMVVECDYRGLEVYYHYQVYGNGASFDVVTVDKNVVGEAPTPSTLTLLNDGFYVSEWYYVVGNGEPQSLPDGWLNGMTVSPTVSPVEWAGETVYIYAVVLPTTRKFTVVGSSDSITDQAFIFNITNSGQNKAQTVNVTFVIFGNDYVNVERLPHGEYTVTLLNWAWRYSAPVLKYNGDEYTASNSSFIVNLDESGDVVFDYSTSVRESRWLSDDIAGYISISN